MGISQRPGSVDRRTILKTSAAIAAVQFSSPFIIKARGETPVRIGMVDPLTGVYAAIAQGEVVGAKFATEEINKKGGILGRPVELLVEDSANDVGTGVQKTRKLIERDQVELHHRRRQFRHRDRDGAGHQRKEGAPYRLRRPHRPDHRHELLVERLPGLQLHHHGRQRHRQHADGEVRQEMVLPDAGLCLWALGAGRLRKATEGRRRHLFGLAGPARYSRIIPPI